MEHVARIGRQAEKSRTTREHVLRSTASLICSEGLPAASPVQITRRTGMSWGAVQHHFGSKDELLKTIVLLSRDKFNEEICSRDYGGLALTDRISNFVDVSWQHYQSEVFLASVEIAFWYRNSGFATGEDLSADEGRTHALAQDMTARVFAGTGAKPEKLIEATVYMHCVLTGLAFQKILTGNENPFVTHLAHCKRAMIEIVLGETTESVT